MGWSMPDEREKFSLVDMQKHFDISRVSLGGPIFDVEKLTWLNGLWLREENSDEEIANKLSEWALNQQNLLAVIPHVKARMETLSDFLPLVAFLATGKLSITEEAFSGNKLPLDDQKKILQFVLWRLEALGAWERDDIFNSLKDLATNMDVKLKEFLAPLFISISGSATSFSVMDAMILLGSDMSRARIRDAINLLGGAGKKVMKKYEKEYAQLAS